MSEETTKDFKVLVEGLEFPQGTKQEVGAVIALTEAQVAGFAEGAVELVEAPKEEAASEEAKTGEEGEGTKTDEVKEEDSEETKTDEEKEDGGAEAGAATEAKEGDEEEEKSEGDELEDTPEEEAPVEPKVGTAVVNSEGLVKTVFTEEEHGEDHAEKAAEYAASGGYQTQAWTDQ